jgi:hypothetical protein
VERKHQPDIRFSSRRLEGHSVTNPIRVRRFSGRLRSEQLGSASERASSTVNDWEFRNRYSHFYSHFGQSGNSETEQFAIFLGNSGVGAGEGNRTFAAFSW